MKAGRLIGAKTGLPPQESAVTPPPVAEEEDRFAFDKYFERPTVQDDIGMTARVSKLLEAAYASLKKPETPPTESEREKWALEKLKLKDIISGLEAQIAVLSGEHHSSGNNPPQYSKHQVAIDFSPRKPARGDSENLELELLRKENDDLRNMKQSDLNRKSDQIIGKLRKELEGLQLENQTLKDVIIDMRKKDGEKYAHAPPSLNELPLLRGPYLSLERLDKQQVEAVLEKEWRENYQNSRHGGSEPLRDPFQKRR
jgi:hypothetical protein